MKNSILTLLFVTVGFLVFAQVFTIPTISTNTIPTLNTTGLGNYSNTNNGTNDGRINNANTYTFSNSPGNTTTNTNNTYNNNGYNYSNNNNSYTSTNKSNQTSYTTNNDGYGSTVQIEDGNGNLTTVETTTDSTVAEANRSIQEKIKNHIVHFTGLVMSDNYNEGNLSKAYVMDKYSEFLKPGKYGNINATLPNSVAYTFDGIAIPPKTRLVIYSGTNFTGTKLVDITGPAIINNNKWEFDERYTGANKKTYCPELQTTFPQTVRQWSVSNMHDWQNGSIEITEVP